MRKTLFILLAAAAVAAVSCAKEIAPETNPTPETELVPMTFTATADDGGETKVMFNEKNKMTEWELNDAIKVISSNGTVTTFKATSVSYGTAVFEGLTEPSAEKYYAVYPASAYVGDGSEVENSKLYVEIPAEQTPVEGSFDPNAFVSIAESFDGKTLSFKNICSVVRFSFQNASDVNSVKFKGYTKNNDTRTAVTNLAGKGVVNTSDITTHTYDNTYVGGTAFDVITVNAPDGGFKDGTNYYFTLRPNTQMTGGIDFYYETSDGISVRKSENTFSAAKNTIRSLGTIDNGNETKATPYESYNLGFDLNVGNKTYNKNNTTAQLLTASTANTSIYNQINNGGLYFLETSGEGSFHLHSNVSATKDVILIGNSADAKVSVDLNGKNVNHAAGTIALKNIALDVDAHTNYVFANNNATADTEAFILDNCSVNGLVKPLYYVNVAAYTLKDVVMEDTDVQLGAATNIIDLSKTTSLGNETVNISNCIFYAASNTVSRIVNNSQNLTSYTADVVFENNTIFNLHAGTNNGLVHMAGANSVVFRNNLVNFYSLYATEYVIRIWKNTPSYTVGNNYFWARATSGIPNDLTLYGNVMVEAADAVITSASYPFASNVVGAGATR